MDQRKSDVFVSDRVNEGCERLVHGAKGLANGRYTTSYRLGFANGQASSPRPSRTSLRLPERGEPPARSHGRSFRMPAWRTMCQDMHTINRRVVVALCTFCVIASCFATLYGTPSTLFSTVYVAQTCLGIRSAC